MKQAYTVEGLRSLISLDVEDDYSGLEIVIETFRRDGAWHTTGYISACDGWHLPDRLYLRFGGVEIGLRSKFCLPAKLRHLRLVNAIVKGILVPDKYH